MNLDTQTQAAVMALMHLGAKYNADDFHVFVNFSGHVNTINLRVYPAGWERDADPAVRLEVDLGEQHQVNAVSKLISALTDAHKAFRAQRTAA